MKDVFFSENSFSSAPKNSAREKMASNKWYKTPKVIQALICLSPSFVGGEESPLISGHVNSPSQKGHKDCQAYAFPVVFL